MKIPTPWIPFLEKAKKAIKHSYSPYSQKKVAAALQTKTKLFYTGCNLENASFGATVCAERVALWKALSEGKRTFLALLIFTETDTLWYPCGLCLQVLTQWFPPKAQIATTNTKGMFHSQSLQSLFPKAFSSKDFLINKKN